MTIKENLRYHLNSSITEQPLQVPLSLEHLAKHAKVKWKTLLVPLLSFLYIHKGIVTLISRQCFYRPQFYLQSKNSTERRSGFSLMLLFAQFGFTC